MAEESYFDARRALGMGASTAHRDIGVLDEKG